MQSLCDSVYAGDWDDRRSDRGDGSGRGHCESFPWGDIGSGVCEGYARAVAASGDDADGGVTLENVGEWIAAGAVAVGVGGNLTAGAKTGDYGSITTLAQKFVEKIKEARAKK